MKNFAEQTAYPKLFKHTYWGAFEQECDPQIIANRNAMVKKYEITRAAKIHGLVFSILDHPELYAAGRGLTAHVIFFISIYQKDDMNRFGFEKTEPIYMPGTTTWARTFFNIYNYRRWLKAIEDAFKNKGETRP